MRVNKKLLTFAAVITVLNVSSVFGALSYGDGAITISPGIGNAFGGGAFNAVTTPVGSAMPFGNFTTFCLEHSENITYGTKYSYVINTGAVKGGYSGNPDGTSSFDPLSKGTAYLYYQWAKGLITHDANNANALQMAIWYLEGETTTTGGSGSIKYTAAQIAANSFLTTVGSLFGTLADATKAANGLYGVVALNVYDYHHAGDSNFLKQDQLAILPEASTVIAGALLLLPLGASAIRILRKSRAV